MTSRREIAAWVAELDETVLLADGFEDAFIGMAGCCGQPARAVYDIDLCIDVLMRRDGMDHEGANEFFEFNTLGAWAGEQTPLFLHRFPTRPRRMT